MIPSNEKYKKEKTVVKTIRFFFSTDSDILKKIESVEMPFATYVKNLIRADIKKDQE
jgi:hypothetical protein